ncbi:checkpoint protein Hus1/Mec3 [Pilobolus umbonatus]|nr:checkpoint protein Hus1/Mec3 [Pilobolus umbonatus]
MRFKATLNNPLGLHKIAKTLDKLSPTCFICLAVDSVKFISFKEYESGIQTWVKSQPQSLFSHYRIESIQHNEINIMMSVDNLLRVTKTAQSAVDIQIKLNSRGNQPFLNWRIISEDSNGHEVEVTQGIDVRIVSKETISTMKEPLLLDAPDAYILLPEVSTLKSSAEKFKSLAKYLILSANMSGVFKVKILSEFAECECIYYSLDNPSLDGYEPSGDPSQFASVRVSSDDFLSFLNCYILEPQHIVCAITDETSIAFYVYTSLESYQTQDPHIRPIHLPHTTIAYHLPIHYS